MRAVTEGMPGSYGSVEAPQASQAPPPMPRRGLIPRNKAEIKDVAQQALEATKADIRLAQGDLPALLAPWFLFAMCLAPVALLAEQTAAFCAFILAFIIVTGFLLFSYGRAWKALAFACLVGAVLGGYLGFYDRWRYLYPYFVYSRSPYYTDVLPSAFPDAYRDAGYLTFSEESYVDGSKGLGYRSGELWCVAPIVGQQNPPGADLQQKRANFWAVGKNCCQKRGSFNCASSFKDVAKGGLVIFDFSRDGSPVVPTYQLAIAAAAQTYDLIVPDEPILVSWATKPDDAIPEIYSEAVSFVWTALGLMLCIVPFLACVFSFLDMNLTKRGVESSEHWHGEEFQQMSFLGVNYNGETYSRELQLGLMNQRCYWSGEVIYDYMFHLANKHMYFGCVFCHPAHPYSKWERWAVAILVSMFIIFPVSAISVKFGQYSIARTVFLLIGVTLPRNILKLYMIQIAQQDTVLELEEGREPDEALTKSAFEWEVTFLLGVTMACIATCFVCGSYIMSAQSNPLETVLMYNCDSLGFAAIMEPLIDMFVPYVGLDDYAGSWTVGFFGRWRRERDHYLSTGVAVDYSPDMRRKQRRARETENAEQAFGFGDAASRDAALMAAAAVGRPVADGAGGWERGRFDRPLFRDAGTEILLDPEARKSKRRQKTACGRIAKDSCGDDLFSGSKRKTPRSWWQTADPFATQPSDPNLGM